MLGASICFLVPPLGSATTAPAQIRFPLLPGKESVPDARALAMRRAFSAIAEGPSAVWWNPGALGLPGRWTATALTEITEDDRSFFLPGELDVYAIAGMMHGLGVGLHLIKTGDCESKSVFKSDLLVRAGAGIDLAERLRLAESGRLR